MSEQYNQDNLLKEKLLVEEIRSTLIVISNLMAIPLFLAFWVADIILFPEKKWEFLGLRMLIFPVCILTLYLIDRVKNYYQSQALATMYAVAAATIINIIIFRIDDVSTSYYAGLNLIAIGGISFIPLNRFFTLTMAVGIYGPYLINIFINTVLNNNFSIKGVIPNLFFIVSSAIICVLIRYFNEKLRSKDFESQQALQRELTSREQIIIKKTEEATKLHQLSSQFSPQVVKAIKDGQISIEKGVQNSKICAVFIDIVRSTEKVAKIPEKNLQIVLEKFLDTCLTTFLKYDLTIDKFHGDGILAYSNMPIQRMDFIERTCMAALESLEGIKKEREFYITYWQSELQVRIGIAVGFANVGFYGNKKYFKTFTAIGKPLPVASRLTSLAQPNQILIDNEIRDRLESLGFVTKNYGSKILKGFEDEPHLIHELVSSPDAIIKNKDVETCSLHPNSVLYLDSNESGIFSFKCRECEYEQSQILESSLQKKVA